MTGLLVRTEPLGGSALARAAIAARTPDGWYEPRPQGAQGWRERLEAIRSAHPADWLDRLEPAIAPTGEAARRLTTVAGGRGVVVTTGQQPGLFGGPLYTWSKALSARALADELERATGIPVAPVFWAATDDADFAEAAGTWVAGPEGAEWLSLPDPDSSGLPMAEVPLGDVHEQLDALRQAAGSAANPGPLDAARRAYAAGATVGSAYVALLREMLEPLGIAVLDASHPAVREVARPVLDRALREAPRVDEALAARTQAIEEAGYSPQVALVPGLSLVFAGSSEGKSRVPIAEAAAVAVDPEALLGPNVLLRPVVERYLLPTAAYVAGPGELSYFAQLSAVADALGEARPLVVPRWSCTVLEPRVRELLARHELEVDDLADPHAPERALAASLLPTNVVAAIDRLRAEAAACVGALSDGPDPLLPPAVPEGLGRDLTLRLDRAERRYRAAVTRRETEAFRELAQLRGALYPGGSRQERALNALPLFARYGSELVSAMLAGAAEHAGVLIGAPDGASTAAAVGSSGG